METEIVCPMQGVIVAIENQERRYYGLQYHPEVKHTDRGMETLKHFLFGIAKLNADWKLENILEEELEKLRRKVSTLLRRYICFRLLIPNGHKETPSVMTAASSGA